MRIVIEDPVNGKIVYEESFWTGRKKLYVNDEELIKTSKRSFQTQDNQEWNISGNYLSGAILEKGEQKIRLTPAIKWYEIVLSILPFLLILIWGNSVTLFSLVPVIGGAVGGLISGIISVLNLLIIKGIKSVWLKILISVGMIAAAFLICFLIGFSIVSATVA